MSIDTGIDTGIDMSVGTDADTGIDTGIDTGVRTATVFVTVGTDHHPFQRLVDWADRLAAEPGLTVVVQHGSATAPRLATGHVALSHEEVLRLMRAADVVVAQGGPGGIMDARACGRLPIVVPRDPARGEHVDDHQQRFAAHLEARGRVVVATDEADLHLLVRRALAEPARFTPEPQESPTVATGRAIEASLEAVLHRAARRSRRRSWRRVPAAG